MYAGLVMVEAKQALGTHEARPSIAPSVSGRSGLLPRHKKSPSHTQEESFTDTKRILHTHKKNPSATKTESLRDTRRILPRHKLTPATTQGNSSATQDESCRNTTSTHPQHAVERPKPSTAQGSLPIAKPKVEQCRTLLVQQGQLTKVGRLYHHLAILAKPCLLQKHHGLLPRCCMNTMTSSWHLSIHLPAKLSGGFE